MSKMSLLSDALTLFAQTTPSTTAGGGTQQGGPMQTLVGMAPIILMFGGLWFLFIAPQRKQKKEHEKLVAALQTGDEIVTTGGIYGTITNVKDDRFVVRVSDNTKIEVGKGFVTTVIKKTEAK
jgi:preprotein translocase subunit YajC